MVLARRMREEVGKPVCPFYTASAGSAVANVGDREWYWPSPAQSLELIVLIEPGSSDWWLGLGETRLAGCAPETTCFGMHLFRLINLRQPGPTLFLRWRHATGGWSKGLNEACAAAR